MKRVDATADSGDMKPAAKRSRQDAQAPPRKHADGSFGLDEATPVGTTTMSVGGQRDSATAASVPQRAIPSLAASYAIDDASRLALPWATTALHEPYQPATSATQSYRDAASTTPEEHTNFGPGLRDGVLNHLTHLQYDLMGHGRVQPSVPSSFPPPTLPTSLWMSNSSIDVLSVAIARGLVNPVDLMVYGRNFTNAPLQHQQIPTSADLLNLQQALLLKRAVGQPVSNVFDTSSLTAPRQHSLSPVPSAAAATGVESIGEILASTGGVQRRVVPVSLPSDRETLSEYQCLLRQQIVFFEATVDDIEATAQGRNKPIQLGQVGILCKHCARLAPGYRPRGAVYFPARLNGIYQAAQNQATNHFSESCRTIPEQVRARAMILKEQKTVVLGGGKQYWARAAGMSGVVETESGLAFTPIDPANSPSNSETAAPPVT